MKCRSIPTPDFSIYNHANVNLNSLSILGKRFKWNRPRCPNGCPKLWGHGFVLRYFSGFTEALSIKRYRCPTCKVVITISLRAFFKRNQSGIADIFQTLTYKLKFNQWPEQVPRQRAGHWMRKFKAFVFMEFPGEELSTTQLLEYLYLKKIPFLG